MVGYLWWAGAMLGAILCRILDFVAPGEGFWIPIVPVAIVFALAWTVFCMKLSVWLTERKRTLDVILDELLREKRNHQGG